VVGGWGGGGGGGHCTLFYNFYRYTIFNLLLSPSRVKGDNTIFNLLQNCLLQGRQLDSERITFSLQKGWSYKREVTVRYFIISKTKLSLWAIMLT